MKEKIIYRKAEALDIPAIAELTLLAYSDFATSLTPENCEKMKTSLSRESMYAELLAKSTAFVCEVEGVVSGSIFLVPSGNPTDTFSADWSYIRLLGVHPNARGKGIGRKLTELCIAQAEANHEKVIALHTSELMDQARTLYERIGFKQIRELPAIYGKRYWLYGLEVSDSVKEIIDDLVRQHDNSDGQLSSDVGELGEGGQLNSSRTGFPECLAPNIFESKTEVYSGDFEIECELGKVYLNGRIFVRWQLDAKLCLEADVISTSPLLDVFGLIYLSKLVVLVNENIYGNVTITSLRDSRIEGQFQNITKEEDVDVTEITFSLLNSKSIVNKWIRPFGLNGVDWCMCELDNDVYSIKIQQYVQFAEIIHDLRSNGGFTFTHFGKIVKKTGVMTPAESNDIITCLNYFLSFVNGRKAGLVHISKRKVDGSVWNDPLGFQNDPYKPVRTWCPKSVSSPTNFLNEVWVSFYRTWFQENESENLRQLVQLYVESNLNLVYIENCLILSQTALELYSNWKYQPKNGKNISAATKIEWVLRNCLEVPAQIPKQLTELVNFKKIALVKGESNKNYYRNDGPGIIVELRNSITHPEVWRKENLKKIATGMRIDAWLLANWYVELCILKAVSYNGIYKNRLYSDREVVELVPWASKSSKK